MRYKIYTAGKVSGLAYEEAMSWRMDLERIIKNKTTFRNINVKFIHPPMYYGYGEELTPKESLLWDMNQIHSSDLVVVNLNDILSSVGTLMELGAVFSANLHGSKRIPLIGIGGKTGYSWVDEMIFRREETVEKAAQYIVDYILV